MKKYVIYFKNIETKKYYFINTKMVSVLDKHKSTDRDWHFLMKIAEALEYDSEIIFLQGYTSFSRAEIITLEKYMDYISN